MYQTDLTETDWQYITKVSFQFAASKEAALSTMAKFFSVTQHL